MLKLRFRDNPSQSVWLVEPKVTLGGSPDNDLVLSAVNVQMHHANVLVNHEKVQLQLVKGAGDTFINERRINDEGVYPLVINDIVRICGQELQLVDPKREPRPRVKRPASEENTGWALKANSAALSNRVYPLTEATVIGRSNECDITLGAAHLSRRHASLNVKNGLLYVKDLGSSNGTYLNGEQVTEARVKRGDELCFDTLSFGVIGPADELDKTTVRSALKPTAASSAVRSAASTGSSDNSAGAPDNKTSVTGRAKSQAATNNAAKVQVTASKSPHEAVKTVDVPATSGGAGRWIALLALLVIAGVVWWLSKG